MQAFHCPITNHPYRKLRLETDPQVLSFTIDKQGVAFDQLIAPGNSQGKALLTTVIGDLVNQTQVIENMAQALELSQLSPDDAGHEF